MSATTLQIIGSIFLALIPAFIWGFIFYRKSPQRKSLTVITFIAGALAVFPILIYKFLWQFFPWINAFRFAEAYKQDFIGLSNLIILPLSAIITFMIVGVIEELMKYVSVKIVDNNDNNEFDDIDDSIEFFIIAALGFSFVENILYFYSIWFSQGADHLLMPFLFRSSFSTLAHLIFSGILGYYYGIAHFATPILQEEIRENRSHWTKWLPKLLSIRKERLFYEQHIFEGLLISIGLHAIFNIFLEMNLTFMIVPFLVGGYMSLNYLFKKKENHKKYGKLLQKERNTPKA